MKEKINEAPPKQKRKDEREQGSTSKSSEEATFPKKRKNRTDFEVEKLLDHKTEKGNRYFFVRWKDYGPNSNSWVRENHLNCAEILKKYKRKHNLN